MASRKPVRWHIAVFLAPAVLVYTAIMIIPLFGTLNLSLFNKGEDGVAFVGLANFATLFGDPRWSDAFWNALGNNAWFFVIHMLVQNPIGIALAAILSTPLAHGRLLPHGNFYSDDPEFRDCGFCLEADPVTDLGHCARDVGCGGVEKPVRAMAG